jgi:hypothetical protein
MRIIIELDSTAGRASITTEADPAAGDPMTATATTTAATPGGCGACGSDVAIDAGPPADGRPLGSISDAARSSSGGSIDAGTAPELGSIAEPAVAPDDGEPGAGPVDAGDAPDLR